MQSVLKYLSKKSVSFLLTTATILVVLIGFIDYVTGMDLSLSVFYLLPMSLVAWYAKKRSAYFISILSALTWFLADFMFFEVHFRSLPFIPYWNAVVRLGMFLIVTYILVRLKQSIESEFNLARDVQLGFLPGHLPDVRGIEFSGSTLPARPVSGDYYDVLGYDENTAGVCVADVVGHGVPAALLMSNLQAAVRIHASSRVSPRELCEKLNQNVCQNTFGGKFITFFFGTLDASRKKLTYTNAGHNPPILFRRDGSHLLLDNNDLVLGVTDETTYQESEVELQCGDRLILFTDGVTELENPSGDQFHVRRLIELLQKNRQLTAVELRDRILQELTNFSKGIFPDDITLLVILIK